MYVPIISSIELAQMPLHDQVKTVFICDEMMSKIKFKNTISISFTKTKLIKCLVYIFSISIQTRKNGVYVANCVSDIGVICHVLLNREIAKLTSIADFLRDGKEQSLEKM